MRPVPRHGQRGLGRVTAPNVTVQDLYGGTSAARASKQACETAGGKWMMGIAPGSAKPGERCYLGAAVLGALNDDCGKDKACDGVAKNFGGCADCHAPNIRFCGLMSR